MERRALLEKISTITSGITLAIAIGAVVSVASHSITDLNDSGMFNDKATDVVRVMVENREKENQLQRIQIKKIAQQLQTLRSNQKKADSIYLQGKGNADSYLLKRLSLLEQRIDFLQSKSRIDSIDFRLKLLEQALGDSPSKSLAIPLIKRDIDGLKESEARDIEAAKAQIAAVYDQNKWFIGLMLTLSLSMISLVVINILPKLDFSKKEKEIEKPVPKES